MSVVNFLPNTRKSRSRFLVCSNNLTISSFSFGIHFGVFILSEPISLHINLWCHQFTLMDKTLAPRRNYRKFISSRIDSGSKGVEIIFRFFSGSFFSKTSLITINYPFFSPLRNFFTPGKDIRLVLNPESTLHLHKTTNVFQNFLFYNIIPLILVYYFPH